MSIQSEITRITGNIADSLAAVAAKGVVVPSGATSDDLPDLIASILTGSGSAITITDTEDANGGTIRSIDAVSLAGDTVSAGVLLSGYTAHDALGQAVTGTYVPPSGSGYDCPVFDILNDSEGHEISITCNKTFAECAAMMTDHSNQCLSAIVRETGQTVDDAPPVWDHAYTAGVYNAAATPKYIRYYATNGKGIPQFQLTYYSDGTIVNESDNLDALQSLNVTANGTYSALPNQVYDTVTVNVSSGSPSLQTKSATPSETAQTITPDSGYDGLSSVSVDAISSTYVGSGITRGSSSDLTASGATVTVPAGYYESQATKSVESGSVTAPSSISGTSATVSTGTNTLTLTKTVSVTPSVTTAGYVSSGTAGNASVSLTASINTHSSSDLTVSGNTITVPSGYYASNASASVASGTAGTPTATKGTVSNHSMSVTPSVTNTTGYITGSTKTGTAVTVSASELVSGSETKTENGTYDVTNLAELVVNVSGSSGVSFDTKTVTASSNPVSLSFTGMEGEPKAFVCRLNTQVSSSGSTSYYYIVDVCAFGTTTHGNCFRIGSTRRVDNIASGYSWSYSGTTLTITSSASSRSSSPGAFYNGSYELLYVY